MTPAKVGTLEDLMVAPANASVEQLDLPAIVKVSQALSARS